MWALLCLCSASEEPILARFIEQSVPPTLATGCFLEIYLQTIETEWRIGAAGTGRSLLRLCVCVLLQACEECLGQWLLWLDPVVQTRGNPDRLWQECEHSISWEAWKQQLRPQTHSRQQHTDKLKHTQEDRHYRTHPGVETLRGWVKTESRTRWIMLWYAEIFLVFPSFLLLWNQVVSSRSSVLIKYLTQA